jgi:hypothetical protein
VTTDTREVEHWLNDCGLIVPPIPASLLSSFRRRDDCVFSSRVVEISPYNHDHYVKEALEPTLPDYVLVAHAGHGVNSYAISYHLAWNRLRLLLQLQWGGTYMDAEATGARIREAFTRLHELWPLVLARDRTARPQFLVASSDFYGGKLVRGGEEHERWGHDRGAHRALEYLATELGEARPSEDEQHRVERQKKEGADVDALAEYARSPLSSLALPPSLWVRRVVSPRRLRQV